MLLAGFILFSIGVILLICYPISKSKNKRCSAQTEGMLMGIVERRFRRTSAESALIYINNQKNNA